MEAYGPYMAIAIGLVGLWMNIRAMATGKNSLARIGKSRVKMPRAFWMETGFLTVMSFWLIILGMQIANWI